MANELRQKLRSKTLGGDSTFANEIVEIDGEEFEVRQPTVSAKGEILQKCKIPVDNMDSPDDAEVARRFMQKVNISHMKAWATIKCTFVPGTDERVFTEEDFEQLLEQPAGGWADELGNTAMRLMNAQPEEDAKN